MKPFCWSVKLMLVVGGTDAAMSLALYVSWRRDALTGTLAVSGLSRKIMHSTTRIARTT